MPTAIARSCISDENDSQMRGLLPSRKLLGQSIDEAQLHAHLQASTTELEVKRHGSGAYLVAITGEVPVSRMKPPMNCSDSPKPYTCGSTGLQRRVAGRQASAA